MPLQVGDFQPGTGSPLIVAIPMGVDGEGKIYARETGMGLGGGAYPDSAGILRINRDDQTYRSVARVKLQSMNQTTSGGAGERMVAISPIPLSPEDAWGVAQDGSIVIARAGDYHLDRVAPDGSTTQGPPVPFEPVSIGNAEKEEYLEENGRSGGGVGMRVEMTDGRMSMSFSRGGPGTRSRAIDQYQWPDRKPPFFAGRIPIDPMGRAWVRRQVEAGEPSTYDIFDAAGTRVGTFLLENGSRVVGFGKSSVYVVAFDELDLSYLRRYAMPGF
jgi:hypothetical protein